MYSVDFGQNLRSLKIIYFVIVLYLFSVPEGRVLYNLDLVVHHPQGLNGAGPTRYLSNIAQGLNGAGPTRYLSNIAQGLNGAGPTRYLSNRTQDGGGYRIASRYTASEGCDIF